MIPAFLRWRERKLAIAWLGACAGCLAVGAALGPRAADRAVGFVRHRWFDGLARAEELVATGRLEQAAVALELLERDSPVAWVKHRDALDHEWLLELLGTVQAELDRKRKSLAAFSRLAEFDPRSWRNHFLLGEACRRFGEPERARDAYLRALELHPGHLGSVAALIQMAFEAGRFAEVPAHYQRYLDAYLLAPGTLRLGAAEAALEFPVDGRPCELDVPVEVGAGWGGDLRLDTAGYSVAVHAIELETPLCAGEQGPRQRLALEIGRGWRAVGARPGAPGARAAPEVGSPVCTDVPDRAVGRVWLRLTAFKAVSENTWRAVEQSYRNLLDYEGLEAARARSMVGGDPLGDARFWPPERLLRDGTP